MNRTRHSRHQHEGRQNRMRMTAMLVSVVPSVRGCQDDAVDVGAESSLLSFICDSSDELNQNYM